MTMTTFQRTTTSYRQGARTMAREYYTAPEILEQEREAIFARSWNCVGRSAMLARPGSYVLADIAGESIILLRGRDGGLRAFFNICRHRGTRILMEEQGQLSETIQCLYHAWTWTTEPALPLFGPESVAVAPTPATALGVRLIPTSAPSISD